MIIRNNSYLITPKHLEDFPLSLKKMSLNSRRKSSPQDTLLNISILILNVLDEEIFGKIIVENL